MAKDSSVNNAANQVNQTINSASSNLNTTAQDIGNAITGAINDLGEGLKLTAKKAEAEKENSELDFAKLKSELDGLRVFMPEMADVIEFLTAINSKFDTTLELQNSAATASEASEEGEEEDVSFDTSTRDVSTLGGLTNIAEITGTGFSLVGNLLHDLTDLFATVLSGVTSEDLKKALVASTLSTTAEQKSKDAEKGDAAGPSKGVLASFFAQLAGPLESVASGLLLLSVAMAVLKAIQLDSQLLGTVILLQTFMLTTFGMLALVAIGYQSVAQYFDPEGNNQGSVTNISKQFAQMVLLTASTFITCATVMETLKANWQNCLIGLVVIFGTALVTMTGLSLIAALISKHVGPEAPISQTIKAFSRLVFLISGMAIFCWLLYPIIMDGLTAAAGIVAGALVTMLSITLMLNTIKATKEQIEAFTGLLKTVTVMIVVLAVLTVILGIIPQSIITQGLIAVGAIVLLLDTLMFMLSVAIKEAAKISQENLKMLMGILITTTVMIAILGVLVYVLGSMDTAALIQGLIAVTLIAAIPIVLLKVMSKIGQSAGQLPQALLGVAIAGLLTVAVAAVAWLIISMLQQFTPTMILATIMAVTLTTAMLIAVGAAGFVLAAMAIPLLYAFPFALIGIAETSTLAVAIAGVALLLGKILNPQKAAAALGAAAAVILTTAALVVVAGGALILAGLAIPILFAKKLALIAISALSGFLVDFSVIMSKTMSIVAANFGNLDVGQMQVAVDAIKVVIKGLVTLTKALIAFNLIAWTLVTQVILASLSLYFLNFGLYTFTINYMVLNFILAHIPAQPVGMEALVLAIDGLNKVSAAINSFKAPGLGKMLGLTFTLNFVLGFAKRLGKIASDKNIDKITTLSTSLSELAQNASGLRDLAGAIQAVSEATKDLNEVNSESKISIESISGQLAQNATKLQEIQKPAAPKDNPKLNEAVEQITEATETLREILENLQNVTRFTKQMASTQEMTARAPQSTFID